MIGHEAVRKYGQAFFVRGARNLRKYKFDRCDGREHGRAPMSAECQQIAVKSEVVEPFRSL
jgi:hypothetical protein